MEQIWRNQSADSDTISLHDCMISEIVQTEAAIVLNFADGFDVTCNHSLNHTGRHKRTGPAAVILQHGHFEEGSFNSGGTQQISMVDGVIVERIIPEIALSEQAFFKKITFEVLSFTWEAAQKHFLLFGLNWTNDGPACQEEYCEIRLSCEHVVYCWNEFVANAWFQQL